VKSGRRIAVTTALVVVGTAAASSGLPGAEKTAASRQGTATSTPIKHLVVLFQENVSYDHYFAT
jgi:phospholipase C